MGGIPDDGKVMRPVSTKLSSTNPQRRLMAAAVLLAVAGSLAHNVMEFGWASLLMMETFSIPWSLIWAAALGFWLRSGGKNRAALWTMLVLASMNFFVGAVLSVLPTGMFTFDPEQSDDHYVSHVIYGVTQIPVLFVVARDLLRRGEA